MVNGLFLQPMTFNLWPNKYIVTLSEQQHALFSSATVRVMATEQVRLAH
jgi:hypothetical protein